MNIFTIPEKSSTILRTCNSNANDLEALEVTALVELLAKGSCDDVCRAKLISEDGVLRLSIGTHLVVIKSDTVDKECYVDCNSLTDMLQSIHNFGKNGSNYFTIQEDHFEPVEDHPCLGLKGHLIRLLGNLCFQNSAIQDRLRNEHVIATILECCKLDARNPLIQQWSILAIRNLCEDNALNQEFIASLQRLGVVKPAVLENAGLVVEESATGLKIRGAHSNRTQ